MKHETRQTPVTYNLYCGSGKEGQEKKKEITDLIFEISTTEAPVKIIRQALLKLRELK